MRTPRLSRRFPAVRLGYVTEMHWPRGPEKTPYRDEANFGPRVVNTRPWRHYPNMGSYLHPNMVKNAAFAYIARRYNSAFEATSLLSSVASLAIPRMTMDISKAGISLGFRLLMGRSIYLKQMLPSRKLLLKKWWLNVKKKTIFIIILSGSHSHKLWKPWHYLRIRQTNIYTLLKAQSQKWVMNSRKKQEQRIWK